MTVQLSKLFWGRQLLCRGWMQWLVMLQQADARNIRGLGFYDRLGAEITDQQRNRCFLRWVPR
jgi:hypothetical protein